MVPLAAQASGEFRRGVNLSHWFEHEGRAPISLQEMVMLHSIGFDHVRIPVDPKRLGWNPARPTSALQLDALREAIHQVLDARLDVIVDISPDETLKQTIEKDDLVFEAYANLLRELAKMLKEFPNGRIAFELLNEPQFYGWRGGSRWQTLQGHLIERVKAVAPGLTIIAMGRMGGSLEGLAELDPYPYPDVIYSFHFYLPYIFTHQGAQWIKVDDGTAAASFKRVLYPSELARTSPPSIGVSGDARRRARDELGNYIAASWNSTTIADHLAQVRDIAHKHNIRIICDEFGVLRMGVDAQSRDRWLRDVRNRLEELSIGWSVWDYADDFAIASVMTASGRREIDAATLSALGLQGVDR